MAHNEMQQKGYKPKNTTYGIVGFSLTISTIIILIVFLALALTAFGVLIYNDNQLKGADPSNDYMELGEIFIALGRFLLAYLMILMTVLGSTIISVLSFVGFVFGISSIRHQETKLEMVLLRTLTYILLTVFLVSFVFAVYLWSQPKYGGLTWSSISFLFSNYMSIIIDKILSIFQMK